MSSDNASSAKAFERRVAEYSSSRQLLIHGAKYIVALSGGADSVALTYVLLAMGVHVECAHCNFHLRGAESDRDEMFCVDLCSKLGVRLHRAHFSTREYAEAHHVSIEMAARELRYGWFRSLRKDLGAEAICVAHHRDDCVETVLMNLVRGTGVHGLRGILPKNDDLIRPMLCVGREDIENYLAALRQDYVTDSTNLVDDVVRNKIRLKVLPLLMDINPSVKSTVAEVAEHMTEACRIIDYTLDKAKSEVMCGGAIDIAKLMTLPSPEYALFMILKDYGFSSSQSKAVHAACSRHEAASGKVWSSDRYDLLIDRGRMVLESKELSPFKEMVIPETGLYVIRGTESRIKIEQLAVDSDFRLSKERFCICVDESRLQFPLHLRRAVQGDRFVPFGMRNKKLLSDFLTDKKKNLFEKRRQLVLTSANGDIIWVVGERVDNRVRVDDTTSTVLRISLL